MLLATGTVSNFTNAMGILDLSALPTGYLTSAIKAQENDVSKPSQTVTCFDNPPAHILNFPSFFIFIINSK